MIKTPIITQGNGSRIVTASRTLPNAQYHTCLITSAYSKEKCFAGWTFIRPQGQLSLEERYGLIYHTSGLELRNLPRPTWRGEYDLTGIMLSAVIPLILAAYENGFTFDHVEPKELSTCDVPKGNLAT